METTYLKINPADNVAVAITPLEAGETIQADGQKITLKTDIPAGHKVTLKDFNEGEIWLSYRTRHKTCTARKLDQRKGNQDKSCRITGIHLQSHNSIVRHRAREPYLQRIPPQKR